MLKNYLFGYVKLSIIVVIIFCSQLLNAQGAGSCLDFDNSNDFVEVPDDNSLDISGAMTLELWFKADSWEANYDVLMMKADEGFDYLWEITHVLSDGKIYGNGVGSTTTNFVTGNWYHIAATYDGSTVKKIYVNGVNENSSDWSGTFGTSSRNMFIGEKWTPSGGHQYKFDGNLDEVRIWNVGRTGDQIRDWMHKTDNLNSEAGLVSVWHFDDNGGTTATDSKGPNNGTLTGLPSWVDPSAAPIASTIGLTNVRAVWTGHSSSTSAELNVTASGLSGTNRAVFGHNNSTLTPNTTNVPGGINRRWNKVWTFDEVGTVNCTFTFTVPEGNITDKTKMRLLVSADDSDFSSAVTTGTPITSGPLTEMQFTGVTISGSYTLGSTTGDNPLPVTLASFSAQCENNTNQINWSTYNEVNNLGWNLYRSTDTYQSAQKLNTEGLIQGAGTTTELTNYEYIDSNELVFNTTYYYWLESVSLSGEEDTYGPVSCITSQDDPNNNSPIAEKYGLYQNYPNPFNPNTEISFALEEASKGELVIYDMKGKRIKTLYTGIIEADRLYSFIWNGVDENGESVASGMYFYKIKAGKHSETKKMILLK